MKSFMSAALQDTQAPQSPAEVSAPQQPSQPAAKQEQQQEPEVGDNAVVVMQGPLGTAITEALNKSLSKKAPLGPVSIGDTAAAIESFAINHVQANGQIRDPKTFLAKISKSVGLVPATDSAPTAINTLLDCASKVEDIDFVMVRSVDLDPSASQVPQKSYVHVIGIDGNPNPEQVAIEGIEVVVKYRKVVSPKG